MAGERPEEPNTPRMSKRDRTKRTERILIARLEELARALERSGAPSESISRLLESAAVATMNAVALNLLTEEAADEIWRDAAGRHPELTPLRHAA